MKTVVLAALLFAGSIAHAEDEHIAPVSIDPTVN